VLAGIARDPEVRLRDIARTVGITQRFSYGIVDDLTQTAYVVKEREGLATGTRSKSMLLEEALGRPQKVGDLLKFLVGSRSVRRGS
jgi:hypothetical protein